MRFPFGRPSTRRTPRGPTEGAELFLLGVYPSALHVRWTRPDGGAVVGALAVDDEPEVFWDGSGAEQRIEDWKRAVGWTDRWGKVGAAGGNGSSGRSVAEKVLAPLGVKPDRTRFTDCLPTYFVKSGAGSQGERIKEVYDEFAVAFGGPLQPAELPVRPSPSALVERAIREEGANLVDQLIRSGAPRVVSLGQEAADVLAGVSGADRVRLDRGPTYGAARGLDISGRTLEWIPLTHPGNRTMQWVECHASWAAAQS